MDTEINMASGMNLEKLILYLHNSIDFCGYDEHIQGFDRQRYQLAWAMIQHFQECGADEDLLLAGREFIRMYPSLLELAVTDFEVKSTIRNQYKTEYTKQFYQ
jgi:hypothetical protein